MYRMVLNWFGSCQNLKNKFNSNYGFFLWVSSELIEFLSPNFQKQKTLFLTRVNLIGLNVLQNLQLLNV